MSQVFNININIEKTQMFFIQNDITANNSTLLQSSNNMRLLLGENFH